MQIINAVWEKRNLGVNCIELVLNSEENWNEILPIISAINTEYQIAKIPVGNVQAQINIQKCDFKFYETNIQLEKKIKDKQVLPGIYSRFTQDIEYRDATDEEIDRILSEVAGGEMFTTDKVAQDPHFSSILSGRRYSLWAKDIIEKGARTVLGIYKGDIASFTIYEKKENYYKAFIGGMLHKYRDRGMGFIPLYVTAAQIYDLGGGILKTGVSSNNPSILKLQLLFGAKITNMTNIYVKHIEY